MRLICFGDSWTAGHGIEEDPAYVKDGSPPTFIERLRSSNSWPRWLANKLDCAFVNFGACGISNEMILSNIEEARSFIKENDVIIVMLSHPHRFRTTETSPIKTFQAMEMLLKNNKRFYFNSFYPSFIDENNFDMSLLPPHFIDPDNCVSDVLKKYEVDNDVSVWEYESRKINDVNNEFHPNILGYKIIGEHLYHILKDKIVDI